MVDYFEGPRRGHSRNLAITALFLVISFFLYFMPQEYQGPIRHAVRSTALYPFLWAQAELGSRGGYTVDIGELRAERDSLLAVVSAEASLSEENRRLRQLLGLRERVSRSFVPAELVSVGTEGGSGTFFLDVGRDDGVAVGSPVIASAGLLGVVWEVGRRSSQAIDWTNADFRASAMTAGGDAYGIVESRRGRYREEDRLVLVGAPFHVDVQPGTRVVTSGRGGVYPRGILLGTVLGVEEADTGWRKSYLLLPAVRPEAVSHVLVGVQSEEGMGDLSPLWTGAVPSAPAADTAVDPAVRP